MQISCISCDLGQMEFILFFDFVAHVFEYLLTD